VLDYPGAAINQKERKVSDERHESVRRSLTRRRRNFLRKGLIEDGKKVVTSCPFSNRRSKNEKENGIHTLRNRTSRGESGAQEDA